METGSQNESSGKPVSISTTVDWPFVIAKAMLLRSIWDLETYMFLMRHEPATSNVVLTLAVEWMVH